MKLSLPKFRKPLDMDAHSEVHAYISDIAELQNQRDNAIGDAEVERFTREIEHAQLVLERLLERVGES